MVVQWVDWVGVGVLWSNRSLLHRSQPMADAVGRSGGRVSLTGLVIESSGRSRRIFDASRRVGGRAVFIFVVVLEVES